LDFVTSFALDPAGESLWVGHLNGLTEIMGSSWKTYTSNDGLLDDQIFSLAFDSDGLLWVGTDEGVMWFDGINFRPAPGDSAVLQGAVSVIFQDRLDRIWFGNGQTTDGGLAMFDGEAWHEFTVENGLVHNMVNAILEDSDGLIWIGSGFANLGGLSLFDGSRMLNFAVEGGLAGPKVRSLYLDGVGNLWAGSEYDGVALVSRAGTKYFTPDDGLSGWEIKAMLQDSEGNLWLGTENGLTRIEQETWEQLTGNK
jgi:ligand-binding sensor domain-containing protein